MKWHMIVALLAMGCEHKKMTVLAVDPNLEPWEQQASIDAAHEWFGPIPEAEVPIHIGEDEGQGWIGRGTEKGCEKFQLGYTEYPLGKAPRIFICPDVYGADVHRLTILHEIGHGLVGWDKEHLPPGNVMSVSTGYHTVELTEADIRFVKEEQE